MLYEIWNAYPEVVSIGLITLGLASVGCTLFVRARIREYLYVKRWLQGSTSLVLEVISLITLVNKRSVESAHDQSLARLGIAFYELGSTRGQRYVFERAWKASPASSLWPIAQSVFHSIPHPKATWRTWFLPAV